MELEHGPTNGTYFSVDDEFSTSSRMLVDSLGLNPSLSLDWCDLTYKAVAGSSGDGLRCFVSRDDAANITGMLPYYTSEWKVFGLRFKVLEPASNLVSYHAELVSNRSCADFLGEFLNAAPRWDVFRFANVNADSETAEAVRAVAKDLRAPLQTIPGEASPFIKIEQNWGDFLRSRNKKFRYKHRKRRELMEAEGLSLVWFDGSHPLGGLLDHILRIEAHSWKARAGMDINSRPHELAYHRQLLPFLARKGMLLLCMLYRDGRPIAYSLCCHQRESRWVGQLKTSFDEEFGDLSPGGIVIDACVERAFGLSAVEFDFLGNRSEHKSYWTSLARNHVDYFLFAPRFRSRSLGWLKIAKSRLTRAGGMARRETSAED